MVQRLTVRVQPQVYTVQAPYVEFDQWGSAVVTYRPLELQSLQVTFPTGPYVRVEKEENE